MVHCSLSFGATGRISSEEVPCGEMVACRPGFLRRGARQGPNWGGALRQTVSGPCKQFWMRQLPVGVLNRGTQSGQHVALRVGIRTRSRRGPATIVSPGIESPGDH